MTLYRLAQLGLALAVILFLMDGCAPEEPGENRIVPKDQVADASQETPADEGDLSPVELGQQIYSGKGICQTCHGPNAEGTQIAPNLADDEWLHFEEPISPEKIATLVMDGVANPIEYPGAMPAKGGANLSDEEVDAVAAYVYSLSP